MQLKIIQCQPGNRQHRTGNSFTAFNIIINDAGLKGRDTECLLCIEITEEKAMDGLLGVLGERLEWGWSRDGYSWNDTLGPTSRTGDAVTKLPRCDAEHATDDEVLNELW